MSAVRGAWASALAPGAYDAYADEYEALPAMYPDLLNVKSSQKAYEDFLVSTGLGTTPTKPELQDTIMDKPLFVGKVRMTNVSYGLGYEVSQELIDDDLYNMVVGPASRFLAQSGRDTEERIAWALFNLAFTTQQAYDGVSLINAAHPLKGGGTYANGPAVAQALSFTSLQASLERHQLMINERGLKIRQTPVTLLVPVQLQWLAREILTSQKKPFEATNTENVLAGGKVGLTDYACQYLTSTTAWFTVVAKAKHRLMFFWRKRPQFDDDYDKKARAAQMFNYFRFGTTSVDWRGLDGSTG